MIKIKERLRHEIINIFTVINFLVGHSRLSAAKKERVVDLIKLASLLIAHENIFLGKTPKFFLEKVDVNDILNTLMIIYEERIVAKKIKISFVKREFLIKADRNYVREALEQIFKKLLESATVLEFRFQDHQLIIVHNAGKSFDLKKKKLNHTLNQKNLIANEISFQLALEILNLNKIKFSSTRNKIVITFP